MKPLQPASSVGSLDLASICSSERSSIIFSPEESNNRGEASESPQDRDDEKLSPEQIESEQASKQFQIETLRDLNEARHDTIELRKAFEEKEEEYNSELAVYENMLAQGEDVPSREDFDIFFLQRNMEITRLLVKAEKDLEAAKERYEEAWGFHPDARYHPNNQDDGWDYPLSLEEIAETIVDRASIKAWLSGLPDIEVTQMEDADKEEESKFDQSSDSWEAKSVAISDAISAHAYDEFERRCIDRWMAVKTAQLEKAPTKQMPDWEYLKARATEDLEVLFA
ncbi:hypothetical protein M501DRAFT_995483 [Patellaria atrata CBS 101060]|uniref:Uncharacterized protein n=1 Tax=Patellaria atrata CBS 101060 TaxID=1346257 RepID=A0A9P4S7N6_9PEZI|nr:hypothetical protein M501DRAFT_995483 [Patellaria atrata CBS 101060]